MSSATDQIIISAADPESAEAQMLIDELSERLQQISGDGGRSSFQADEVRGERAVFVIARDASRHPLGCGALRPLANDSAELKRMYARPNSRGTGSAILLALEEYARTFGYRELCLETRQVNVAALAFYAKHEYLPIPNFGRYAGRADACCLAKILR